VNEEYNRNLMDKLSEEELKEVLHNFQKDKILGPDGWNVKSFLGLYDLIGRDILKVVEEYRMEGYMHTPLNATFISLMPKSDPTKTLEEIKPISLCNCI
jgi:hypothetical protein